MLNSTYDPQLFLFSLLFTVTFELTWIEIATLLQSIDYFFAKEVAVHNRNLLPLLLLNLFYDEQPSRALIGSSSLVLQWKFGFLCVASLRLQNPRTKA